ncbi:NAD(P)H-binding protein, partial [Vibrio diabolicus]
MKKVLVLGASGYIGSQLLPLLLDKGYAVTAAARHIDYLESRARPHPNLTLRYLDLADAEATLAVVNDFDLVFFLVHGMAQGDDFVEYELNLALNFKYALEQSRVKHVIYLSAIQPQTGNSRHLAARKATGKIIRQSG